MARIKKEFAMLYDVIHKFLAKADVVTSIFHIFASPKKSIHIKNTPDLADENKKQTNKLYRYMCIYLLKLMIINGNPRTFRLPLT